MARQPHLRGGSLSESGSWRETGRWRTQERSRRHHSFQL